MKKLLTILITITGVVACYGQAEYEPQILVLSPNEMTYDKIFKKEIADLDREIKARRTGMKQNIADKTEDNPENVRIMMQNETDFFKTLEFSNQISLHASGYLAYRFFEKFENLLITVKNIKCSGASSELKKISEEHRLQYVLNFPRISFYKREGVSMANVSVQLYDGKTNEMLLDQYYTGDWDNPGFDFTCQDSSLDCTISNALSQALSDVIKIIATNSPTLQRERTLARQRFNILLKDYYSKPFDTTFISKIILPSDSNVNLHSVYQCLIDDSKTKFVAFFLEKGDQQNLKSLTDNKQDQHVNIISGKDIKDPGFLDAMPRTYAYIVKGVKYQDKWYYQKVNATYFEADDIEEGKQEFFNNLQSWDFFKENTADPNPDFWETNLFAKEGVSQQDKAYIELLKSKLENAKDEKEKETSKSLLDHYSMQELKNSQYAGLYKIVADEIRKHKRKEYELFSGKIQNEVLVNFYENYCRQNRVDGFIKMNGTKLSLLFPQDKSVLLSPVVLDYGSGRKELNYFVLIPGNGGNYTIYHWNYFKPVTPKYASMYGSDINEQLNQITKWNFSFDTLDDKNFWEQYVLLKEGNNYKYLKQIK